MNDEVETSAGGARWVVDDRAGRRGAREQGTEAGSFLRLIDSCITRLKAQGHSRTSNESKEEEEEQGCEPDRLKSICEYDSYCVSRKGATTGRASGVEILALF